MPIRKAMQRQTHTKVTVVIIKQKIHTEITITHRRANRKKRNFKQHQKERKTNRIKQVLSILSDKQDTGQDPCTENE